MAKTTAELIADFENRRAQNVARMNEIMEKANGDGVTLDASEQEEYDGLEGEIKQVDAHIDRLKKHAEMLAKTATPVTVKTVEGGRAVEVRGGSISSKRNLEKGTSFTRYAMALAKSKGNLTVALELAKQWHDTTPEVETVLKAAVAAGDTVTTNWAVELADYTYMASEFIELLRPETLLGRIPGFRRVPFMIRMPKTASGVTANWVGQGAPKPVSKMDFDTVTFAQNKIAVICVLTEELVRFSSPAAEATVRQDMIEAISQFMDQQFIDPTVTVNSTIRPASITNGATNYLIAGATVANVTADLAKLMTVLVGNNIPLNGAVWIMHPRTALNLSLLRTTQDMFAFPNVTVNGGTLQGLPVVTSANVPIDTGDDSYIVLMQPREIFLADDGGVSLDVSREASLQMDSAPSAGAQSLVSLWANNLLGLRAERYVTYARRRTGSVAYLKGVSY